MAGWVFTNLFKRALRVDEREGSFCFPPARPACSLLPLRSGQKDVSQRVCHLFEGTGQKVYAGPFIHSS